MNRYKFYSKIDSKKEPLGKILAHNIEEAIKAASYLKNLSVVEFLKIFDLEKLEDGEIQRSRRDKGYI
jgi:hypothetical protein